MEKTLDEVGQGEGSCTLGLQHPRRLQASCKYVKNFSAWIEKRIGGTYVHVKKLSKAAVDKPPDSERETTQ
jgi:hypothetical protein